MKKIQSLLIAVLSLPVAAQALTFAVNEGATYRVTDTEIQQKYKLVAEELGKLLGQKVNIVPVSDYPTIAEGLAASKFDLAYIHPSHLAFKAMASDGYKLVALTKGFTDYKAHFLVRGDSTARSMADLKGRKLGVPSPDSVTSVLARTTMREAFKEADAVSYLSTRYQDAIPFMIENGFVEAGVTGSEGVAKAWVAKGGKVAFSSKPVPVKLVLASKNVAGDDLAALQAWFISLDTSDKGRKLLEGIDKKGFVAQDQKALANVGSWMATGVPVR